jgi:predicted peroxiredoxin
MRILYALTAGASDPTRASVPVHLAVNGSQEIGDEVAILMAGDSTELVAANAMDDVQGVGVPPLSELFAKVVHHLIPVYV